VSETFQIHCPSCNGTLNAKTSLIGQTRHCPKCQTPILIQQAKERRFDKIIDRVLSPSMDELPEVTRKAAERGDADAQFRFGASLEDDAEAVKWYRPSAEQGNADAIQNLPLCKENKKEWGLVAGLIAVVFILLWVVRKMF